jgi:hypothetical protein
VSQKFSRGTEGHSLDWARMSGRGLGAIGFALALSLASGAGAQAVGVSASGPVSPNGGPRLEWRAPLGCPRVDEVLARVASLANDDRLRWDRFQVIRGAIERGASSWSLALDFVATNGVRRRALQSAGCAELGEAAAVAIVLAHRSDGEQTGGWDPPAPREARDASAPASNDTAAPSPPPVPEPPRNGGVEKAPAREEPTSIMLDAAAEAVLDPSTLGTAAFGASMGMELSLGAFSTALYATGFPSATTRLRAGQSLAFGLWAGGLRGCYRWGRSLDMCALMELGQLTAEGVGLAEAGKSRDPWAAPGLSVGFRSMPFDGFGITTRISAFHPLVRGSYRVDDSDLVHRIPVVGFRAALGIDLPLL